MTKYELIYKIIKENYDLVLLRRERIRNRINLIAGFGLAVIVLIFPSVIESINIKVIINDCFKLIIFILFLISFFTFSTMYLMSFGIKKFKELDNDYIVREYHTLVNFDLKAQTTFLNQLDYYKECNIDNAELLAENDVIFQFESVQLSDKINDIYDENKKISLYSKIMNITLLINILVLIIMKGVF